MRSRITITISQDLLDQVDQTIDNKTVRNRSQAIEALLRQVVSPKVSTAVILAGGSLTKHPQTGELIGKSLIPIQGKPVIIHLLNHLKGYGVRNVVIATSPNSENELKSAIKEEKDLGLNISYSDETETLGTGGALKAATSLIPQGPFYLFHGDLLTNINLNEMVNFHHNSQSSAVIAVKPRPGRLSYGRVFLQGSTIIDYQVPQKASPVSLVNTGIYLFDYSVISLLPSKKIFKLEDTLIPTLVKQELASGWVFQGIWFDVSESDSYQEANDRWDA